MDKIRVKVRPAGTNVKVQYEGEELTIKELVGKLEYLKEVRSTCRKRKGNCLTEKAAWRHPAGAAWAVDTRR